MQRKDFVAKQEVRWCPGCGDYAILATVQRFLATLTIPKENIVFISGIGCAGRFPYYMNTYGFHTLHGRAFAVATGLKIARPELSVWVITGDGDGLSIGGNHLIHALRRNLDINVLLFNNRIYGLTKGQYSPTSELGKVTGTTPQGSLEEPINPLTLALSAGATFVARALDIDSEHLTDLLNAAYHHQGTSFIEIYQNCNIFNDGAYQALRDKGSRWQHVLYVKDKTPLQYGDNQGLIFTEQGFKNTQKPDSFSLHEVDNWLKAQALSYCNFPDYPVPLGLLYQTNRMTLEDKISQQIANCQVNDRQQAFTELLKRGSWRVD